MRAQTVTTQGVKTPTRESVVDGEMMEVFLGFLCVIYVVLYIKSPRSEEQSNDIFVKAQIRLSLCRVLGWGVRDLLGRISLRTQRIDYHKTYVYMYIFIFLP